MVDDFYGIGGDDDDACIFIMGDEDDISLEREKKAISKDHVNYHIEHSKNACA